MRSNTRTPVFGENAPEAIQAGIIASNATMSPNRGENVVVTPRILSLATYTAQHTNQSNENQRSRAARLTVRALSPPRESKIAATAGPEAANASISSPLPGPAPKRSAAIQMSQETPNARAMNFPYCFITEAES